MNFSNPDLYPIEALPETLRNAVLNVQEKSQAPLALIASSALGAISLACQNSINVRSPSGIESPASLFFLTIAESGERKTSVDKLFTHPIREFEENQKDKFDKNSTYFEANLQTWKIQHKTIHAKIENAIKEEKSTEQLTSDLAEHISKQPKNQKPVKLIYEDTTPEALKYGLYERWPSAGLISDEAGSIFNGRAISDLEMINTLWSGGKLQVDRRGSPSFSVTNARLTLSLMVQEKTLERYFSRRGSEARDSGLLARFLVAKPTSTQGTRFIQNRLHADNDIKIFQSRISTILEQNFQRIEQGIQEKTLIEFSDQAVARWIEAYNLIEFDMNLGYNLSSIKDHASKFAENIARLAALLHYFEGMNGEISYDTVDNAARICTWHTHQFKEIFSSESNEIQDVKKLDLWLVKKFQQFGIDKIKMTEIRQSCPNSLRQYDRLNEAMKYFLENDFVRIFLNNGTKYIHMNPEYFFPHKHWSSRNSITQSSYIQR